MFDDFVESALRRKTTLSITLSDLPVLIDSLRDAQHAAYPNADMGRIGAQLEKAFCFSCPSCGELKSTAVLMGALAQSLQGKNPGMATAFGGPNIANLASGKCPGCGGTTLNLIYDPRQLDDITPLPNEPLGTKAQTQSRTDTLIRPKVKVNAAEVSVTGDCLNGNKMPIDSASTGSRSHIASLLDQLAHIQQKVLGIEQKKRTAETTAESIKKRRDKTWSRLYQGICLLFLVVVFCGVRWWASLVALLVSVTILRTIQKRLAARSNATAPTYDGKELPDLRKRFSEVWDNLYKEVLGCKDQDATLKNDTRLVIVRDLGDRTLLHRAVEAGNSKLAKTLIANGADVNIRREDGLTLIEAAIESKDLSLATELVRHGANVNGTTKSGGSLLRAAAWVSDEMTRLLLDNGAHVKTNDIRWIIFDALQKGPSRVSTVEMLVAHGADLKQKESGATLLHEGHLSKYAAGYLIAKGLDVNARDSRGRTPLYMALVMGDQELAEFLLKNGADPETGRGALESRAMTQSAIQAAFANLANKK